MATIAPAETAWVAVTNWAALVGQWTFSKKENRFEGPWQSPGANRVARWLFPQNEKGLAGGTALGNERLRDGAIRATMRIEAPDHGKNSGGGPPPLHSAGGILLGYRLGSSACLIAGLGFQNFAYAVLEYVPGSDWQLRKGVGSIRNLEYDRDYVLRATLKGQRISLEVDGVLVIDQLLPGPPPGNQIGIGVNARSPIRFRDFEIQRRGSTAFASMPFGTPYDSLYQTVVKPVAEDLGFEVTRIGEVSLSGIAFRDIQQSIGNAQVVIAEVTAPNQNVFYEVGYAHGLNKPTILLAQQGRDLPFDVNSGRVIFYDDSIGGETAVEGKLRERLHAILKDG